VTAEQLRAAFGFEQWSPDEQDVQALKDAPSSFSKQITDEQEQKKSFIHYQKIKNFKLSMNLTQ
jgi:hypothetical protein